MAAGGAACLLLSGCGSGGTDPESMQPVKWGKPAPSGTLPISASGRQVVTADKWPDACSLLSDGEIRALLPQATRITRKPEKNSASSSFLKGPREKDRTAVAPRGSCEYGFRLANATEPIDDNNIYVRIMGIGGPRLVRRAYDQWLATMREGSSQKNSIQRLGSSAGPEECFLFRNGTSELTCRQGPLLYATGGLTLTSRPFPGVPTGTGKAHAKSDAWTTHAVIPAAATIATKIN